MNKSEDQQEDQENNSMSSEKEQSKYQQNDVNTPPAEEDFNLDMVRKGYGNLDQNTEQNKVSSLSIAQANAITEKGIVSTYTGKNLRTNPAKAIKSVSWMKTSRNLIKYSL